MIGINSIQYIWFVGPSGSGKTTAVEDCFANENHILRRRIGIGERNVALCIESLNRDEHHDNILDYLNSNYSSYVNPTAVLIDGQWSDIEEKYDTIRKFGNGKKDAIKIIWLNCSPEEATRRCRERNKRDWEIEYDEDQAQSHHNNMAQYIEKLKDEGFEVEVINSSDADFNISDWSSVKQYCK